MQNFKIIDGIKINDWNKQEQDFFKLIEGQKSEFKGGERWCVYFNYEGNYTKPYQFATLKKADEQSDFQFSEKDFVKVVLGQNSELLGGLVPLDEQKAWEMIWNLEDGGFIARAYTQDFVKYEKNSTNFFLSAVKSTCEAN